MKRNKWLLSLSIGLLCCGSAYAQTTVKGKITSEGGEPLIGATVAVKNSTDGTVTDIDGNYSIKAAPGIALVVRLRSSSSAACFASSP